MLRLSKSKSMKNLKISGPVMSPLPPLPTEVLDDYTAVAPTSRHVRTGSIPRSSPESSVILITKFDFKAENKYELSVGVGEAVKLLGRKGNGWILVKPIGRISEPGLIPASYVRIVRLNREKANPKSDEKWLSQAGNESDTSPSRPSSDNSKALTTSSASSSERLIERPLAGSATSSHSSLSSSPRTRDNAKYSSVGTTATDPRTSTSTSDQTYYSLQSPYPEPNYPTDGLDPFPVSGLVRNANSYNGRYWYRVDIALSDGKKRYLCRYYQDFYKLHCSILDHVLSNRKKSETEESIIEKLPALPDPIPRPDLQTLSSILLQRCQSLNVYIFKIVQNKSQLDYGEILDDWSKPRLGDLELGEDTQLSNDSIEDLLRPLPTNVQKATKPQLSIQTSVTPPLPLQAPQSFASSKGERTTSATSLSSMNSPMESPKIWPSPTFSQTPTFAKERSISTSTIHEEQEAHDWMTAPTEPLFAHKRSRNGSAFSIEDQYIKMKVYYVDDIFALRLPRTKTGIADVKNSIAKRLECEANALRLYYKNQAKNYFSPLVDDLDVESAFTQGKVSVKVHIWDDRI